jgi:hypothetical protein
MLSEGRSRAGTSGTDDGKTLRALGMTLVRASRDKGATSARYVTFGTLSCVVVSEKALA